jgi:hypothetical protein
MVINLLGTYSSLAAQYPDNKLEIHRFNSFLSLIVCLFLILMHVSNFRNQLFSTWANDLEENLSTETCRRLVVACQDHFNIDSPVLIHPSIWSGFIQAGLPSAQTSSLHFGLPVRAL